MTRIRGCLVAGATTCTVRAANRLGASALMQGLADGYFIIPSTVGNYLAGAGLAPVAPDHGDVRGVEAEVRERGARLLAVPGGRSGDHFHRELGRSLWGHCGTERGADGLPTALQ